MLGGAGVMPLYCFPEHSFLPGPTQSWMQIYFTVFGHRDSFSTGYPQALVRYNFGRQAKNLVASQVISELNICLGI